MRAPLSWIREYVDLPADLTADDLAHRLTALGLKLEALERHGHDVQGPLVVGRVLEFVRVHEMSAQVRLATKRKGVVPSWNGGKMPLSSEMADSVQALLQGCAGGDFNEPELVAAQPMLLAQQRLSLGRRPSRSASG